MEAAAKRMQPMAFPAPVAFIPAYAYGTDAAGNEKGPILDAEARCRVAFEDPRALKCADESLRANRSFLLKAWRWRFKRLTVPRGPAELSASLGLCGLLRAL